MVAIGKHQDSALPVHEEDGGNFTFPGGIPKNGCIYVVIGFFSDGDILGLRLIGHPVFHKQIGEVGWDSRCFRELEEMKALSKDEHEIF